MEPGIGRSIKEGFRAANRSWAGIGFMAACSIGILLVTVLGVMATNPPQELFQQPAADEREPVSPAEQAAQQVPVPEEKPGDLFKQMGAAEESPAPAQSPEAMVDVDPAAGSPSTAEAEARAKQERALRQWLGRAWPVLLVLAIIVFSASLWIAGGQIGYLVQWVRGERARVSEFWVAGTRSFGALLAGSLMWLLALGGLSLMVSLVVMALSALAGAAPGWIAVVLGLLLGLAGVTGLIWAGVRLSFWFIAIVADRLGPIQGLRSGFRRSRGRWWRLFCLGVLMVLISVATQLPFGILEGIGNLIGGAAAVALVVVSNLTGSVVNLYVAFAMLAAYVRFYEDTKADAGAAGSSLQ